MRRRVRDDDSTPLRLRRFVAEEWGGGPDAPVRWYAALDEWQEAGHEITHDPGTEFPDVPFDPDDI